MAILWTILATALICNCVVSAKTIFERVDDENNENSRIARFRAPKDEETVERRGVAPCGCETGTTDWDYCFPDSCPQKSITINLKGQYVVPPTVSVSISALDVDKDFNTRVKSWASDITTKGFKLHYQPWSDTNLYGISLSWTACA